MMFKMDYIFIQAKILLSLFTDTLEEHFLVMQHQQLSHINLNIARLDYLVQLLSQAYMIVESMFTTIKILQKFQLLHHHLHQPQVMV